MGDIINPSVPTWRHIQTQTVAAPTPNVNFTDLSGYRELLFIARLITSDTGGTDIPAIRVSIDNGASFLNTNYKTYVNNSTGSIALGAAQAAGSTFGFVAEGYNFNVANEPLLFKTLVGLLNSSTGARAAFTYRDAGTAYNALQAVMNGGANFTAGTFMLFGKVA